MEDIATADGPATPTPPARWQTPTPVPVTPTTVPVTPTRGNKRMVMGTPRPTRQYRPPRLTGTARSATVGFAAASALEQILAAIAGVERGLEERTAALEARMTEVMAAMTADADGRAAVARADAEERERRTRAGLLANADEREKRVTTELLSVRAIETGLARRAEWEVEQWEKLSDIMGLWREDIREVKRAVDGIAAAVAGQGADPAPAPTPRMVVTAPEAMEGVRATAPLAPEEDPVEEWSDMEGVEREGLFASRHVPGMDAPIPPEAEAPESPKKKNKRKEKGKAKEREVAVPPSSARAARQQRRQTEVDRVRAVAATAPPTPPAAAISILKCPETVAAEKEKEKEKERLARKVVARATWDSGDLSKEC